MKSAFPRSGQVWFLVVALALLWGSSFLVLKRVLETYDPIQVFAGRMFFAALTLLPFSLRYLPRISARQWPPLLALALIANFATTLLNALAQVRISSSLAGTLNSLTPLMTLLIGVFFYRRRINRWQILGVFGGLIGTLLLLQSDQAGFTWLKLNAFALFVIGATLCMGFTNNLIKYNLPELSNLQIASVSFLLVLPLSIAFGWYSEFFHVAFTDPTTRQATWYLIFLGVASNALALLMLARIITLSSPVTASLVTYLIPIIATIWGWWDGEAIYWYNLLIMALIIGCLYLVNHFSEE